MKKKLRIFLIVFILSFIFFRLIFSDWEHFKAGILGKHPTPTEKTINE